MEQQCRHVNECCWLLELESEANWVITGRAGALCADHVQQSAHELQCMHHVFAFVVPYIVYKAAPGRIVWATKNLRAYVSNSIHAPYRLVCWHDTVLAKHSADVEY